MIKIILIFFASFDVTECTQFSMRMDAVNGVEGGKPFFAECPASHPFAYKYGKMCCDSLKKEKVEQSTKNQGVGR